MVIERLRRRRIIFCNVLVMDILTPGIKTYLGGKKRKTKSFKAQEKQINLLNRSSTNKKKQRMCF